MEKEGEYMTLIRAEKFMSDQIALDGISVIRGVGGRETENGLLFREK